MTRRDGSWNAWGLMFLGLLLVAHQPVGASVIGNNVGRERISLNTGWRFRRTETNPDGLVYEQRPDVVEGLVELKQWILPAANEFIVDPAKWHERPAGNPGSDVPFVQKSFDDRAWEAVTLPHDWGIKGPFYIGDPVPVGGGMGRLPVQGVGWYRRKLTMTPADEGRSIYLDVDGAMSYAIVWLNGNLVGGWPYGYNSFRLDLTPYLKHGDDNQLAIRLDNPTDSARWYPGAGLYRNVWLTKTDLTHIAQSGTHITSKDVSAQSATVDIAVRVENKAAVSRHIKVVTTVHVFDSATGRLGDKVAEFPPAEMVVPAGQKQTTNGSVTIKHPDLWGPVPAQRPNLYIAVTELYADNKVIDKYETKFVNGEPVRIQGVNNHHDLGAIGAAFNVRAAQRQLEILRELGCNSIRMSHNPPAAELLDLTDQMGFLVLDEIFDSWERNKTKNDFHLIFPDWHEPDLRAFLRRDRNHPSIISWSYGNEVGEQYTNETGAELSQKLLNILHEEDSTRPGSASINYAKPDMFFPRVLDIINLNYQGAGIRDTVAYSGLQGIRTQPLYPEYHATFPNKLILSSESASTLSTRGTFIFPVTDDISAPVNDTSGGDPIALQVSAYELYTAGFGSSPDKVFESQDKNPYAAGEMVWTGFDYIGEPTPYYSTRSSYSGIIDLAGFKKDRFWLYQSRWRPDLRMAHILPHWSWPDRVGQVTPVHVFSAADEAELFLNGKSLGRKKKAEYEYRFRWRDVIYEPGELRVVTYKAGAKWATETVRTASDSARLKLTADRAAITADGYDLSFITVEVVDDKGTLVPRANDLVTFSVRGPGEIVATDNGDPADMVAFPSTTRKSYSGLALAIVRAKPGATKPITVTATAKGLAGGQVTLTLK